ncbi:MAG: tetratricopeptide repeat protein [Puniceicoccaceae bacterium]|nr:MAG: tetratricopeptide repeat protein [Puniceicoccaceae bacterium]
MKKPSTIRQLCALAAIGIGALSSNLNAQLFPLSENLWSNEEFKKRFLGSYGFDTDRNPTISADEQRAFRELIPIIERNPSEGAQRLRALITSESSAALDYTLANLYVQAGNTSAAIRAYETAIRKFPNFFRAYRNLGLVLVNESRFEEAIPFLQKGLELGGTDGSIYGPLALCFLNTEKPKQALTAYKQALIHQPGNRQWQMGMLRSLMDIGHYTDAAALLEEMIGNRPEESDYWTWQANAFLSLQESNQAGANLEILKRLGKANAASLALLGDIYMSKSIYDMALENYLAAAELEALSTERVLRTALGFVSRRLWDEANAYLAKTADRLDSLTPREQSRFRTMQAQTAIGLDDVDRAANLLEQVVSEDPMNGQALLTFADLQSRQGNFDEAAFTFEQAAKVEETRVDALVQHARMLVGQREFSAAVPILERAVILEPGPRLENYLERVQQAARAARG